MDKLLKLSFQSKEDWEDVKQGLLTETGWVEGIKEVFTPGFMQKPPAEDWQPDPDNPEDNGWTTYSNYAVDIVVDKDFDYSSLVPYCLTEKEKYGHVITGSELEVVVVTNPIPVN